MLPSTTMSNLRADQVCSLKPQTSRPRAFAAFGSSAVMILTAVSSSPNKRALCAIIQCSEERYLTPSTVNALGHHWLRQDLPISPEGRGWCPQKYRYLSCLPCASNARRSL